MLTTADFVALPCTPDLTAGGISYATRTLSRVEASRGDSLYEGFRQTAAEAAVELAFRRFLTDRGLAFSISRPAPFTMPDGYFVGLGGHRCRIHTFLISRAQQAAELHADAAPLLDASALVPSDEHAADSALAGDLYLFAFYLCAAGEEEHSAAPNERAHLLHAMPSGWRRPRAWRPLGPLALKSEGDQMLTVEISGLNEWRDPVNHSIALEPLRRTVVEAPFFSVSCIHAVAPPRGRLGIHSEPRKQTLLIAPTEWRDVVLQPIDIFLAGYIRREEFGRRARQVRIGSQVGQFRATRLKSLAVEVRQLRPVAELLSALH